LFESILVDWLIIYGFTSHSRIFRAFWTAYLWQSCWKESGFPDPFSRALHRIIAFLMMLSGFLSLVFLEILHNVPKLLSSFSVRIDPLHPLVCRKRRLNGAVLRIRPEKPRSRVTAGVAR
jgi:hypothetical protein